jgi:hypothetical protein
MSTTLKPRWRVTAMMTVFLVIVVVVAVLGSLTW